jgi:hypothetical protein
MRQGPLPTSARLAAVPKQRILKRQVTENAFDMRWAAKLLLIIAVLSLALAGSALAQGHPADELAPKPGDKSDPVRLLTPMVFYVAKGEPHTCGRDCSEWIAAEGSFDLGAAQRLRNLLARFPGRKPPIFFHSPGGIQSQAMAIGRLLREYKMTAGVAETIPKDCASTKDKDKACAALKRSGRQLMADLRAVGASCNSACVYAFIDASVRQVQPAARLGVHSAKLVQLSHDGRVHSASKQLLASGRSAAFGTELRRYIGEMGIDLDLFRFVATVPHEQIRYLSRDQIARFGIDTREFQETRWTTVDEPQQRVLVTKFFVEASGTTGKEFRTNVIGLSCAGSNRVSIAYFRGLVSDQAEAPAVLDIAVASRKFAFSERRSVRKIDAFDTGSSFDARLAVVPIEFLDAGAVAGSVEIIEADSGTPTLPSRVTKLSTQGLVDGISALRRRCANPA